MVKYITTTRQFHWGGDKSFYPPPVTRFLESQNDGVADKNWPISVYLPDIFELSLPVTLRVTDRPCDGDQKWSQNFPKSRKNRNFHLHFSKFSQPRVFLSSFSYIFGRFLGIFKVKIWHIRGYPDENFLSPRDAPRWPKILSPPRDGRPAWPDLSPRDAKMNSSVKQSGSVSHPDCHGEE